METSDYWHALDRTGLGKTGELEVDPLKIGISHGIGDVGEGLKANVFRGLRNVELGFFGTGKGFRTQPTGSTPESFGHTEREDMRQLARINEVELSTHAAPDLGPLSGFTGDRFSKETKEASLQEVRRALDFAAETAGGGAVVVHIGSRQGEFPRALYQVDEQFQAHPEEKKRAPLFLVNEDTGQVTPLARTIKLPEPVLDEQGNIVSEDGKIKYTYKTFADYEKEAMEEAKKKGLDSYDAGEYLYKQFRKKEQELAEGESLRYFNIAQEEKQKHDALKRVYDSYTKKLEDEGTNVEAVRTFVREQLQQRGILPEQKGIYNKEEWENYLEKPEVYLKDQLKKIENIYKSHEEIAISRGRDAKQVEQEISKIKPIQEYALGEIKDSLARSALDAYKLEKERGLERPLFISPENWSPESYGSHPKEYKDIILKSREEMADRLVRERGMKLVEAKKVAEDHIRGTFDIGHLNFWRKYFKGSDEEFREWVDKEIQQLTKENIIGSVHLSDNFGYHDEHLAPGEGNAPIERFVERLEKAGYKGRYIAEPGGQKEGFYHTAWTGAMNVLRSPIYRVDSRYARWTDIEHSYFGLVPQTPGFLVGDIIPSKDWTLWSETPLE
ncbi:hypothetical protein HYS50_02745 [Candidatus Woesearchaeota archaeon]|nr:hypothetical protein [Candidatus Woesearchaeota archaeon]